MLYKNSMDKKDSYLNALEQAIREYEQLSKERSLIDERLSQLIQTMNSLSRLCALNPTVELGLTDACRMALKTAGHPLTAAQIRGHLEAMGVDCSRYANPLASIHTVLRRLCRSGEASFASPPHEKPVFAWKQPVKILALSRSEIPDLGLWLNSLRTDFSKKR